jgi:hypothetical protein
MSDHIVGNADIVPVLLEKGHDVTHRWQQGGGYNSSSIRALDKLPGGLVSVTSWVGWTAIEEKQELSLTYFNSLTLRPTSKSTWLLEE